jgi:hypothetical protein
MPASAFPRDKGRSTTYVVVGLIRVSRRQGIRGEWRATPSRVERSWRGVRETEGKLGVQVGLWASVF